MSKSVEFSDQKRQRKGPEKTNFVHTCNLLTQFIKEKGSLRDLNFEIGDRVESLESIVKADKSQFATCTRSKFASSMEYSVQPPTERDASVDPVLRPGTPASSSNPQDASNNAAVTREEAPSTETKNPQLTIFYAGRVLVFDDCPAEKVTEIAEFVSKETSKEIEGTLFKEKQNTGNVTAVADSSASTRELLPPRQELSASHKAKCVLPDPAKEAPDAHKAKCVLPDPAKETPDAHKAKRILVNLETEKVNAGGAPAVASPSRPGGLSPQLEASGSDLPIARRSSLHRFLAKRKDRTVREQNQNQDLQPAWSSKPDEHLELKL